MSLAQRSVVILAKRPLTGAQLSVLGSLRRELFDHVIIVIERHLKRLLSSYLDYYHPWRTHRPLAQDAPDGRPVRSAELGQVVEIPVVQGLHHYHLPRAA